jgi:hypothetical protein
MSTGSTKSRFKKTMFTYSVCIYTPTALTPIVKVTTSLNCLTSLVFFASLRVDLTQIHQQTLVYWAWFFGDNSRSSATLIIKFSFYYTICTDNELHWNFYYNWVLNDFVVFSSGAHEGPKLIVFRTHLGLLPEHLRTHKTGVVTLGYDQTCNCCLL